MARLTSDFFVAAYLRRMHLEGAFATLRRRGNAGAGAIFVIIDHLDGTGTLYGPAPPAQNRPEQADERFFLRMHADERIERAAIENRIEKEIAFDQDCWIVEVETRQNQHFLQMPS
jgi:hypothetical protein